MRAGTGRNRTLRGSRNLPARAADASDAPLEGVASAPSAQAFVAKVEQFCRRNLSRPIGVQDMARVAKMSRFHFSRQFDQARGVTPGRFLATLRIERAKRLLVDSELSVNEVAPLCGFADANYLCKVFRREYGVSPGRFKSSNGARTRDTDLSL